MFSGSLDTDKFRLPMTDQTVVMLSGGLDSVLAWVFLGKPDCIHVDLGVPYSAKEKGVCRMLASDWGANIVEVNFSPALTLLGSTEPSLANPFLPARNLLLATIGAQKYSWVCIAGVKGDRVEDKTPEAYADMSVLLTKHSRKQVTVFSPFWRMTKRRLVAWYLSNGYPERLLRNSVSCYDPAVHIPQCGRCGSCFRKWVALAANGVNPLYDLDLDLVNVYRSKLSSDIYDSERRGDFVYVQKHHMLGVESSELSPWLGQAITYKERNSE